jgi:hypothetical protein
MAIVRVSRYRETLVNVPLVSNPQAARLNWGNYGTLTTRKEISGSQLNFTNY